MFVLVMIYYYRRDQLKKITESEDKTRIDNMEVAYSYLSTILLIIIIVNKIEKFQKKTNK